MSNGIVTGTEWSIIGEGFDADPQGNWVTRVVLHVFVESSSPETRRAFILLQGNVTSCDDERWLSEIEVNRCLPNDDAAVMLLGMFDAMRPFDLHGGFSEFPLEITLLLELLYDDPFHVAWLLSRFRGFFKGVYKSS